MTSKEILKADVLDILFENRNKNYGAYTLRKYYNNRLGIALTLMIAVVCIFILIVSLNPEARKTIATITGPDTGPVVVLPPPVEPPPIVEPQRINTRTENFVNRIQFVPDDVATDMPDQDDLGRSMISNYEQDGEDFTGVQSTQNANNTPAPAIATPEPTPPPAPTTPAAFPGGQEAWMAFLNKHLRTPDELEAGQKRTVSVRFAVGVDGSITQFEIIQSGGAAFDNEVIRVLKKMPKWKPAVQNGQNVSVMFTQPVTFVAYEE